MKRLILAGGLAALAAACQSTDGKSAAQTPAQAAPAPAAPKLGDLNILGMDPASGKAPKQLVVMFHGYTQQGGGMAPLAADLSKRLPNAAFVFNNGPLRAGPGFSWYDFRGDTSATTKAAAKDAAVALVKKLSDTYHVPPQNIVTVGFSQGGGVAVEAGICQTPDVKAVVSLAGVIESTCPKEASGKAASILIVRNQDDATVKTELIAAGVATLKAAGYDAPVENFNGGTAHWPAPDAIKRAEDFIVAQLGG